MNKTLGVDYFTNDKEEDRVIGSILTVMIGDILGAGVEGHGSTTISKYYSSGVTDFISAAHMGIYELGERYGMYTDDTNSTLALATSLVQKQYLDAKHCAESYSKFYFTEPKRGYPDSAQKVLYGIKNGMDYKKTGTIAFQDGSYANGGAMRITPIGLAFRNATDDILYEACRLAIISSHVHPEAIDGAYIIVKCIQFGLSFDSKKGLDEIKFLKAMKSSAKTEEMKKRIENLIKSFRNGDSDEKALQKISGSFQIRAVEAVPVVLWGFIKYWKNPEEALIKMIGFGGDTDTTACILGGILGSIHGTSWIPHRWFDNMENGKFGRDYCIEMGRHLFDLNLKDFEKIKSVQLKEKGNEYYVKQEFKSAFENYIEALKDVDLTRKLKIDLYSNCAQCKVKLNEFEDAVKFADECLSIDSKHLKSIHNKSFSLLKLEKYTEAMKVCEIGLEIDSEDEKLKKLKILF
eukprot:gene3039-5049_t